MKEIDSIQYSYAIETFSTWAKKGCSSNSGRVKRSLGSFYKQIRMNSLACSETFVAFENLISSYT